MEKYFYILISWVRKEDMQLLKSVAELDNDTTMGQNYMYWKEDDIAKYYAELFDFDEEVEILAVERIEGLRTIR